MGIFLKNKKSQRAVVLDNVRSTHNVGAIFRTADAAGIDHIYIVGYTPQPIDRFGRTVSTIAKTALGAEKTVPWTYCPDHDTLLQEIHEQQLTLVAVEQTNDACSLYEYQPPQQVAYVFGNEVEGVSGRLCQEAQQQIHIPMYGRKESLNVSVSVGIVLFVLHPAQYHSAT